MMQGSLHYLIVWFALSKLGATEVPINTAYKGHLLEHVLKTTEASIVILDPEFRKFWRSWEKYRVRVFVCI